MAAVDPFLTSLWDQATASAAHTDELLAQAGVQRSESASMDEVDQWVRDAIATMDQARQDNALRVCDHLTSIQPMAVLAEAPRRVVCWSCYTEARAVRACLRCGCPAGTASLLGGVESLVRGPAVLYSRMLCMPCAYPASPGGTFGSG
ncbi:hypothetical protein [Kitasatospora sp. NPDC091276]|uniref:hypothetical protein n=1 Tax=unclassified Kitasatospora TaxID=2633591 RepID=UPI003433C41A